MHLLADADGNESLVFDARLSGERTFFLLDTAYAGAPVLSSSLLAAQRACATSFAPGGDDVGARYRGCLARMRDAAAGGGGDGGSAAPVRDFLMRNGACRAYTSGCTMRLMGISETVENQADMLLCPSVELGVDGGGGGGRGGADVLVTNPLPGSPHILTVDYLLHRAPCVLCPARRLAHFRVTPLHPSLRRASFELHEARFVGGAYVVPMRVGGATLSVVVDTGASASLSVSSSAAGRLGECARGEARRVTQVGVNGERVCSDVVSARVEVGSIDFGTVEVLVNTSPVQGADAYCGMGILRAVDLWLEPHCIGFRRSGLPPRRDVASASRGECDRRDGGGELRCAQR